VDTPNYFETVEERGYFRPAGSVSLDQGAEMIDAALRFARARGLREVVVNVTGLTGFASPALFKRYSFVRQWAETVRGRVRLAIVARPELIDRERFGVTVARNRGLMADVFVSEADAIEWLERKPNAR
jgi:hypothetical protein